MFPDYLRISFRFPILNISGTYNEGTTAVAGLFPPLHKINHQKSSYLVILII
jgi:hypothetical protein